MKRRSIAAFAALSTALLVGCAGGAPDPMAASPVSDAPVRLTVQNHDFNDAVLYASWNWEGGGRYRIGTITGKSSQTVNVPWRGDVVYLDVDFIGGTGYAVDPMTVGPGDHVDLVLQPRG